MCNILDLLQSISAPTVLAANYKPAKCFLKITLLSMTSSSAGVHIPPKIVHPTQHPHKNNQPFNTEKIIVAQEHFFTLHAVLAVTVRHRQIPDKVVMCQVKYVICPDINEQVNPGSKIWLPNVRSFLKPYCEHCACDSFAMVSSMQE